MTNVGVELDIDQLILTRGRDFRWTFTNLDDSTPPQEVDYPAGSLFFELSTHGEVDGSGHISESGANGGTYTLHMNGHDSNTLTFDASQSVVQQEIEAFPDVGVGNVSVTGSYTPQWIFQVAWNTNMSLSAGTVELFNSTVTTAFTAMSFVTGNFNVWLSGNYTASTYTFKLTYKGSLLEEEMVNFVGGVISEIITAIQNALTAVEQFTGEIANISLIYAPLRNFTYEFIHDKALTPMPEITVTSALTGTDPAISVVTDEVGRAPYTIWPFTISGATASLKVESEECDLIPDRTRWQLVFMPDGEPAGGDPVARGFVRVQATR